MSLKRSASEAAMGSPKKGDNDDDNIDATKKELLLTDLPIEALSRITMSSFDINNDIDTIVQLANSSSTLFDAFRQWLCTGCNGVAIFDTEEGVLVPRTDSAGNATAFSCVTCGEMFCGQNRCGQRYRSHCSKCNLRECGKCSVKHFYDCPMCMKYFPHCLKCKGECTKGCDLCGFPACDNHAKKCDTCGIQTCGIHDFGIDVCSYCEKGFCPRCHGQGDCMNWCQGCDKRSCMTGNCEEFKWCGDGSLCSECYVEEEESEEEDFEDEDGENGEVSG